MGVGLGIVGVRIAGNGLGGEGKLVMEIFAGQEHHDEDDVGAGVHREEAGNEASYTYHFTI